MLFKFSTSSLGVFRNIFLKQCNRRYAMKKFIVTILSALLTIAFAVPAMASGPPSKEDVLNSVFTTLPLDTGMQTHIAAQPNARFADYIATGLFDPGLAVVAVNDEFVSPRKFRLPDPFRERKGVQCLSNPRSGYGYNLQKPPFCHAGRGFLFDKI